MLNYLTVAKWILLVCTLNISMLHAQSGIQWPNGAKAAICLTYDDGMETHLTNAIPQLDSVGLKGTFFMNAISGKNTVLAWRKAARDGHELANHSLLHPCPDKTNNPPAELSANTYTVAQMLDEIATMNGYLRVLAPRRPYYTYAYPCSRYMAGDQNYVENLRQSGLVRYARTGSVKQQIVADFQQLDFFLVPCWGVLPANSTTEIIDFAQQVKAVGGLGVYGFHGIGGQWISTDNEKHRALLAYLKANQTDFWVAPFGEIMEWIEKHK